MLQRDYLLRMIEQAMQAVLRAFRLLEENKTEEAQASVDEAYRMLGIDREVIDVLAPASALGMIGDEKRLPAAMLFLLEAELAIAAGRTSRARRKAALAEELYDALERSGADESQLAELRPRLRALHSQLTL